MKYVKILVVIFAALAAGMGTASAFDCRQFLIQGGLGNLDSNSARLSARQNDRIPRSDDLVNLKRETVGDGEDKFQLKQNAVQLDSSKAQTTTFLKCRVLRAAFVLASNSNFSLLLTTGSVEANPDFLIFQFREVSRDEPWPERMPIKVRSQGNDNQVPIDHLNFTALKAERKTTTPGQFVALTSMNNNARPYLAASVWPGEDGLAATALALCEPVDCTILMERLKSSTPQIATASAPVAAPTAPATAAAAPPPAATPASASANNLARTAPPHDQALPPIAAGPIIRDGRGDKVSPPLNEAETGGTPCILDAISPGIFSPRPNCSIKTAELLKGEKPQIRIDKNEWVIVRAQPPAPKRLEVLLAPGQDGLQCKLQATYISVAGASTTVTLDPAPSSGASNSPSRQRASFGSNLTQTPEVTKAGVVSIKLKPSSEAECGAPEKMIDIPARSEILSADLAATSLGATEIIYVLMPNDNAHPLDDAQRTTLGAAMLDAVLAAHRRAVHFRSDLPWALVDARIGVLTQNGAELLSKASGTDLRKASNSLVSSSRSVLNDRAIRGGKIVVSTEGLIQGLRTLGSPLPGVERVIAVFIGLADTPSALNDIHDSCKAERYSEVLKKIDDGKGPNLEMVVFPMVWMDDFNRLKTTGLAPVDIVPGLPDLPGRMMGCSKSPEGIRIYPYLAENWREPNENAQRFGVSVSDRLGALIDEILSSGVRRVSKK